MPWQRIPLPAYSALNKRNKPTKEYLLLYYFFIVLSTPWHVINSYRFLKIYGIVRANIKVLAPNFLLKQKMLKIIASFSIALSFLAFSSVIFDFTPHTVQAAFVECGNDDGGKAGDGCQVSDFFSTVAKLINYLFAGAGVVAVLGIIYGGGTMAGSAGNQSKLEAGKKAVINSLIGLAIVLLAIFIVQAVLATLTFKDGKQIIDNPVEYLNNKKQ